MTLSTVVSRRSHSTIRMPSVSQKTMAICLPALWAVRNFLGWDFSLGLCFLFRGVVMKPWPNSCYHSCDDSLMTCTAVLECTIWKDWLLHLSGSYKKDGNTALTSVGSMRRVLSCDYVTGISLSWYSRWVWIVFERLSYKY
jgi:hypothetical protein